jgi:hypothetical protein
MEWIRGLRRVPRGIAVAVVLLAAGRPALAQGAAQQAQRRVTVLGRVIDSLVQPVTGATVEIPELKLQVTTDGYGRFRLVDVPDGAHVLSVRKIGYGPVDVAIQTPRDTSLTPVVMVPGAVVLKTIVTRTVGPFDKPARLAYTGKFDDFYMRRHLNVGSDYFYTREDIDRMGVMDIRDVLRRIPGLRLWDDGGNTELRFPSCPTNTIMIMVDGQKVWPTGATSGAAATLASLAVPMMAGDRGPMGGLTESDPLATLRSLRPSDIEGVEVYPSSSTLPVETVGNACAAIFFWTGTR